MPKASMKVLLAVSAGTLLLTAPTAYAAPGYIVGKHKYLQSDLLNPSILRSLNEELNTTGLSNLLVEMPDDRGTNRVINYKSFVDSNPGNINLSSFSTFAPTHPVLPPADTVIIGSDGSQVSDTIMITDVYAQNGKLTVAFDHTFLNAPAASDFVVKAVYGGQPPRNISVSAPQLDPVSTSKVILAVPQISSLSVAQEVYYTVSYQKAAPVPSGKFAIDGVNPAISGITASNGVISLTFSPMPVVPLSSNDFVVNAVYGGQTHRNISVSAPQLDPFSSNKVILAVPQIPSLSVEQDVYYTVSYQNAAPVQSATFTIGRVNPAITGITASNGLISLTFSPMPVVPLSTNDFVVNAVYGGQTYRNISVSAPQLDPLSSNKVILAVPQISSLSVEQEVYYTVSYRNAAPVQSATFAIDGVNPAITGITASNGLISLTFSPMPVGPLSTNDFVVNAVYGGQTHRNISVSAPQLDPLSSNKVILTMPQIPSLSVDQDVFYTVSYKNADPVQSGTFAIAGVTPSITSITSSNGSISLTFSPALDGMLFASDLIVKQKITDTVTGTTYLNNSTVSVSDVQMNADNTVATLTVPLVGHYYNDVNTVYTVTYGGGSPVTAAPLLINAIETPTNIQAAYNSSFGPKVTLSGTGTPGDDVIVTATDDSNHNAQVILTVNSNGSFSNDIYNNYLSISSFNNGQVTIEFKQKDLISGMIGQSNYQTVTKP